MSTKAPNDFGFDRLPPHSIEAEMAVLGSMMIDSECIPRVQAIITREAFYQGDNQIIFDAIMALYRARKGMDPIVVREHLHSNGKLEEIGGTGYLGQVLSSVHSAAHVDHYAGIVRNRYARRQMIRLSNELQRSAYAAMADEDTDVPAIAMQAAGDLVNIGTAATTDGFRSAGDIAFDVVADLGKGKSAREPIGIPDFDQVFGGLPIGGFTMVAARPSMGKSLVALNFALLMAQPRISASGEERPGLVTCVISVEDTAGVVASRLMSRVSEVPNHHISYNALQGNELQKLGDAAASLSGMNIFITDAPLRLSEIEAAIIVAKAKYKADVIIVDYLQLIDDELGIDNENRQITEISRRLKFGFKRAGVVGVACVQLNRANEKDLVPPPPTMKSLRGSGSLEQDADMIIALHGEDYYRRRESGYVLKKRLELHGIKNKGGPQGKVIVFHDNETMLIRNRTAVQIQNDILDQGDPNGDPF
jgi:replicative DNA helicase